MELHFYPGQYQLLVLDGKRVIARYDAKGEPRKMGNDSHMPEEPTTPGVYVIANAEAYRTLTWGWSEIKWGTALRDKGMKENDVWYRMTNGKWASIKKDYRITREDIVEFNRYLYGKYSVPETWVFNAFGPIAIRWFRDVNGNGKLDGDERLSGQMFHTTPDNEAQAAFKQPVTLTESHGCIHLKPADRDRLFAAGAFKPGTRFTVHRYDETAP